MADPRHETDPLRDPGLQAETGPEPAQEAAQPSLFDHASSMETLFGEQHLLHEKSLLTQMVANAAYAVRDRDGWAYNKTAEAVQKAAAFVVNKYGARSAEPGNIPQPTRAADRQTVAEKYGAAPRPGREQERMKAREPQPER